MLNAQTAAMLYTGIFSCVENVSRAADSSGETIMRPSETPCLFTAGCFAGFHSKLAVHNKRLSLAGQASLFLTLKEFLMNTKEKIAVMQAYEDGATVQLLMYGSKWRDLLAPAVPLWDWHNNSYRIKPEPKFAYVNVYSYANAKATDSASYPTAERAKEAAAGNPCGLYHAIAMPVELKEE